MIRDRDGKYPDLFDQVFAEAGIEVVLSGVRMPLEHFYNERRPHQGSANTRPLRPLPVPLTDSDEIARLDVRRHDRLGGILHEYQHAA